MKVGVLGSGDVAKTLAAGFLKHGHEVTVGSRSPGKLSDWIQQNPKAAAGSFADAAAFGEVVVLAVKGKAAFEALRLAGAGNLAAVAFHREHSIVLASLDRAAVERTIST